MKKIILSSIVIGSALFADGAAEMVKEAAISKAKTEVTKAVVENVSGENIAAAAKAKDTVEALSSESNLTDKVIDAVKEKAKDASQEVVEKAKDKAMDMAKDKVFNN